MTAFILMFFIGAAILVPVAQSDSESVAVDCLGMVGAVLCLSGFFLMVIATVWAILWRLAG